MAEQPYLLKHSLHLQQQCLHCCALLQHQSEWQGIYSSIFLHTEQGTICRGTGGHSADMGTSGFLINVFCYFQGKAPTEKEDKKLYCGVLFPPVSINNNTTLSTSCEPCHFLKLALEVLRPSAKIMNCIFSGKIQLQLQFQTMIFPQSVFHLDMVLI